jgi:hypothetical protein
VANWAEYQGFDFVYWNMLHDAPQWSIANLPANVKQSITAYLGNCNPPEQFKKEFDNIRDFMNNGQSSDGSILKEAVAELDRKRNQNFATVCPEMAELIGYGLSV